MKQLKELEEIIGYSFKNQALFITSHDTFQGQIARELRHSDPL